MGASDRIGVAAVIALTSCATPYTAPSPRPLPALARERPRMLDARREERILRDYVLVRTPRAQQWAQEIVTALEGQLACPIPTTWADTTVLHLDCTERPAVFPSGAPGAPRELASLDGRIARVAAHIAEVLVVGGADEQRCCQSFPASAAGLPPSPSVCDDCPTPTVGIGPSHEFCNRCLALTRAYRLSQSFARLAPGAFRTAAAGAGTCWQPNHATPRDDHARRVQIVIRARSENAPPCSIAMTDPASTLFCYQEVYRRAGGVPTGTATVTPTATTPSSPCPLDWVGAASSLGRYITVPSTSATSGSAGRASTAPIPRH